MQLGERVTFRLSERDRAMLRWLQDRYGLRSEGEAARCAVRQVVSDRRLTEAEARPELAREVAA
jgi:hypothetical protein